MDGGAVEMINIKFYLYNICMYVYCFFLGEEKKNLEIKLGLWHFCG